MKKLVLVTVDLDPQIEYHKQLKFFFGDYINIESYLLDTSKGIISGDMVVVTTATIKDIVIKKMDNPNTPIIYLQTTFCNKQIEMLNDIPSGSDVLVISNYRTYAKECIQIIDDCTDKRLNLVPYYIEVWDFIYKNFNYGLYIGDESIKLDNVNKLINIGYKVIHPNSLNIIIEKLFRNNTLLLKKLETYSKDIININFQELLTIKMLNESRKEINALISVFENGIIIIDNFDRIIDYNEYICRLFDIKRDVFEGKHISKINQFKDIYVKSKDINDNSKLEFNCNFLKKHLIVYKKTMRFQHVIFRKFLFIEAVGNIKKDDIKNKAKYTFTNIITNNTLMKKNIEISKKISQTDSTILITGETGTGKELFAQAIHNESYRRDKPFLAINCATFLESILASELFGYEKGTFTGALKEGKKGIFENANGGTVFLDEIGDAPLNVQAELLRVLEEKEIRRLGGNENIPVNVRIISATNKDLKVSIDKGLFRKDLFYRLNTFTINIPPLRERNGDITLLTKYFLKKNGYGYKKVDMKIFKTMENIYWDGNIRELKNFVNYLGCMSKKTITINDFPLNYRYIICNQKNSNKLFLNLNKNETEICIFILKSLLNKEKGRESLYKEAVEYKLNTTLHEIRKALEFLSQEGFIKQFKGRIGSKITTKGIEFLKKIK